MFIHHVALSLKTYFVYYEVCALNDFFFLVCLVRSGGVLDGRASAEQVGVTVLCRVFVSELFRWIKCR